VTLYTRSGLDWTARFPAIAADIARLPAGKLVLDGEVISADAKGHPSFSALQDDLKRRHYADGLLRLRPAAPRRFRHARRPTVETEARAAIRP
jgi:ATP-dependent DNA ligase